MKRRKPIGSNVTTMFQNDRSVINLNGSDWSPETRRAVRIATDGLPVAFQHRFHKAWLALRKDWQRQIAVQLNAAREAAWNRYLSRIVPKMIQRDQLLQLHGMFIFIGDAPAHIDHEMIARAVRRKSGPSGERRYREIVAEFFHCIGSGSSSLPT